MVFVFERALDQDVACIANACVETIVDRSQYEDFVARLGETLQDGSNGRNDACGVKHVLTLYVPIVATREPADNGFVIRFWDIDIAKYAMIEEVLQRIDNAGGCSEVHISHPKGQDLWVVATVPLHAIGTTTGNDFIEVVFHNILKIED